MKTIKVRFEKRGTQYNMKVTHKGSKNVNYNSKSYELKAEKDFGYILKDSNLPINENTSTIEMC